MSQTIDCPCAIPGCRGRARLTPLRTAIGPLNLTEGLCAHHMRLASPDRVLVMRAARLELMVSPGLEEIVLFVRAWEAVKMSAQERDVGRAA